MVSLPKVDAEKYRAAVAILKRHQAVGPIKDAVAVFGLLSGGIIYRGDEVPTLARLEGLFPTVPKGELPILHEALQDVKDRVDKDSTTPTDS